MKQKGTKGTKFFVIFVCFCSFGASAWIIPYARVFGEGAEHNPRGARGPNRKKNAPLSDSAGRDWVLFFYLGISALPFRFLFQLFSVSAFPF